MTRGVFELQEIINLQKKIVPEVVDLLEKRYNILRAIFFNQPIGRRVLANELGLSERIVRTEITFLKGQGLIEINTPGMTVTEEGEELVHKLNKFMHKLKGLSDMEREIKNLLNVKKVIIVPGDVEKNPAILSDLGKAASDYLKKVVKDNDTIAITGGTAVKETVESLSKVKNVSGILVVPARGGMGRTVEVQANTLAALLASKLNGTYKMLHIPENISPELLESLKEESEVKEVLESVETANIYLYGIGNAIEMAQKRGLSEKSIEKLKELDAIGEACGCYFNKASKVVAKTTAIGINIYETRQTNTHIAVAGGKNKVESIIVTQKGNTNGVMVTDEACGREIIRILSHEK